jgi:hypothetical protein
MTGQDFPARAKNRGIPHEPPQAQPAEKPPDGGFEKHDLILTWRWKTKTDAAPFCKERANKLSAFSTKSICHKNY